MAKFQQEISSGDGVISKEWYHKYIVQFGAEKCKNRHKDRACPIRIGRTKGQYPMGIEAKPGDKPEKHQP